MLDEYLKQEYESLAEMSRTITKGRHPDWEDLLHICLVSIYEASREKIHGLITRRQLKYWLARMMMNQYNSSTSPYHYQYRKHAERIRRATPDINSWFEDTLPDQQARDELLQYVDDQLKELPYFDRMVTKVYYHDGHSLNSLSAETGISRTTLFKALKRTREEIKKKYTERPW